MAEGFMYRTLNPAIKVRVLVGVLLNFKNMIRYEGKGISAVIFVLFIIIAVIFVQAWIVQLLWNWLVPMFWANAPILTYWQSFGCCVLLSIIGGYFRSSSK